MGITEDIADNLAKKAIAVENELEDESVIPHVATLIGASSQTTQEAFLTAVRVRKAEARAVQFLKDKLAGKQGENLPSSGDIG